MTQETVIPGSALNFSLDFGAADTTQTFTIKPAATSKLYPYFYRGFAVIPDWTNAVTLTVTIVDDADGNSKTLYTSSALAKNGTREMTGITGELPYEISIVATLSGVPGGTGGTVYFTFYSTENASGANASVGASVNVAQINSVTPQLDDTDKLAVSIYGKSVAAGDVALLLDAAGNPQVDVVSSASDTDISTIATNSGTIASDTTNILADTGSMDTNIATIAGAVSGSEMQVDVVNGGPVKPRIKTIGAIIDLVGSGSAPTEIDTSAATVVAINVDIEKKCRCCFAADSTAAATAMGSDTSSWFLPAGWRNIPVNGSGLKFYIRSFDATGLTDGCSYTIEETV